MLWAWIGLSWLWIKNKGRKSYSQLEKENPDYEQTGIDVLWNIFLGAILIAFLSLLIYGIYRLFRILI